MPVDYDVRIDLSLGLGLGRLGVVMVSLEYLNRGLSRS
jgi:hypothetical protein